MKHWKSVISSIALGLSSTANAALITENFTATVMVGEYAGTVGTGTFTYNDVGLTGVGTEIIGTDDGLSLEFTVFGQTFTESDDVNYPWVPELIFMDGSASILDYFVSEVPCAESCYNLTNINYEGVFNFGLWELTPSLSGGFQGELEVNVTDTVSAVPVPAAAWLFGTGVLGLIGAARRKRAG